MFILIYYESLHLILSTPHDSMTVRYSCNWAFSTRFPLALALSFIHHREVDEGKACGALMDHVIAYTLWDWALVWHTILNWKFWTQVTGKSKMNVCLEERNMSGLNFKKVKKNRVEFVTFKTASQKELYCLIS